MAEGRQVRQARWTLWLEANERFDGDELQELARAAYSLAYERRNLRW